MTNIYNKTDLDPVNSFERHIFHRDQFAHYLRWTFILKNAKIWQSICDFWCWKWNLFEVFYRNRYKPKKYTWLDIRWKTIENNKKKFNMDYVEFIEEDLVTLEKWTILENIKADVVTSFEVIEHIWKLNVNKFLQNFKICWNSEAIYYLSTPNYDEQVWAAGNHTYPNYKWWEPVIQEFSFYELQKILEKNWFEIIKTIWMFASQKDYKKWKMEDWQEKMFKNISNIFDTNIVSVIMAWILPAELSRNTLWILKIKK